MSDQEPTFAKYPLLKALLDEKRFSQEVLTPTVTLQRSSASQSARSKTGAGMETSSHVGCRDDPDSCRRT